jgi:hypothetical protein
MLGMLLCSILKAQGKVLTIVIVTPDLKPPAVESYGEI